MNLSGRTLPPGQPGPGACAPSTSRRSAVQAVAVFVAPAGAGTDAAVRAKPGAASKPGRQSTRPESKEEQPTKRLKKWAQLATCLVSAWPMHVHMHMHVQILRILSVKERLVRIPLPMVQVQVQLQVQVQVCVQV